MSSNYAHILLLNCQYLGQPGSLEQILEAVQGMGFSLDFLKVGSWAAGLDASWKKFDDQMRREIHTAYDKRNLAFLCMDRESHLSPWFLLEWESVGLDELWHARLNVEQSHTVLFTRKQFDREFYAQRYLEVGKRLYSIVQPAFGWIERVSPMKCLPGYTEFSDVEDLAVPMIYWANFFGPEYVDKLGKEYLMNAPGWKVEELKDGGVLYVLSPNMAGTGPKAVVEQVKQYFDVDWVRRRRKK